MRNLRLLPGLAALATLAFVLGSDAQEKKPVAEKHDGQALSHALRDVINTGADLFNTQGDYAGCYRVYQGGLLSIKPFLTPDLQKKIDQSIAQAERLPRFSDRAFELRKVIDEIRAQSKGTGEGPPAKVEKIAEPKKEAKQPEVKKETKPVDPKPKEEKKAVPAKEEKKSASVDPSAGQVAGKVTYSDKPAPPGFVTLVGASQKFSASIGADGSYSFKTPIPPGKYRVAIERVPGAQIPAKLDIPERFRAEATSGITLDVGKGKNFFDINLVK